MQEYNLSINYIQPLIKQANRSAKIFTVSKCGTINQFFQSKLYITVADRSPTYPQLCSLEKNEAKKRSEGMWAKNYEHEIENKTGIFEK